MYFARLIWLVAAAVTHRTVADEVCTMEEAQQLYPQLGLLANLGLVGSGKFIKEVHRAVGHSAGMGAVLQVRPWLGVGGNGKLCAVLLAQCRHGRWPIICSASSKYTKAVHSAVRIHFWGAERCQNRCLYSISLDFASDACNHPAASCQQDSM